MNYFKFFRRKSKTDEKSTRASVTKNIMTLDNEEQP